MANVGIPVGWPSEGLCNTVLKKEASSAKCIFYIIGRWGRAEFIFCHIAARVRCHGTDCTSTMPERRQVCRQVSAWLFAYAERWSGSVLVWNSFGLGFADLA